MSLSTAAAKALNNAIADKDLGEEIAAAIDAGGAGPAGVVAAIGDATDLVAGTPAASALADNAKETIDTALNLKADQSDYAAMVTAAEARLAAAEAKIDEVIAALKAADMMDSA